MFLRNSWISFSLLVIALCLSLYFQNPTSTKSLILDQYKVINYNQEVSHSLSDFNKKIFPLKVEDLISDLLHKNRLAGSKTRIMEIGTGNGRTLMELKKKFPEVEFYGINKEKTHAFYRRESYIMTGLKFNLFTPQEIEQIELPFIIFENLDYGERIPYGDEKFDLIFSQNTISQFKYKFELFNEIMRILKTGGSSLHTDLSEINIYSSGELLPLKSAFAEMRKEGLNIRLLENSESLIFKKISTKIRVFPVKPHIPFEKGAKETKNNLKNTDVGYNLIYE